MKNLRVRLFSFSPVRYLSFVTLTLVLFLSPQNVSSIFAGIHTQNSYIETTMIASHSTYALSYNIATSYLNKGMIDEAIAEYKTVLDMNPDYAEAHNSLGVAYFSKGMIDEAIAEYKKELCHNSDFVKTHYNLGIAYFSKGMIDEAIAEYKTVLDMNPDYAEAHNNLAVAYFAKECLDLAWKHVRIAQKSNNPPNIEFLKLLKKASKVNQQ
jgi:tetratricopeptide (TPR) repeat protein